MAEIPGSNLEELALNQAEIVSLLNDHLWCLWAFRNGALSVANQPAGGESNGDIYIVGDTPAGDFSAQSEGDVAILIAGAWHFLDDPQDGWKIWVIDEDLYRRYDGSSGVLGWIVDDPDKVYQTLTPADNVSVDWSAGSTAYCLLDRATTTFAFSGAYPGQRCVLILEQSGGNRDAAFGAEVRGGTDTPIPPTLTATDGKVDHLGFIYNGTDAKYDHVSIAKGF